MLLPIRLLKTLDAIINIPEHHVFFGKHAVTVPMRELSSGHMVIRVTEFAQAGFQVPEELQSQYDFRCGMEERETNAVMLAQQRLRPGTTSPRSVLSPVPLFDLMEELVNRIRNVGKPKAVMEPTISSVRRAVQHSTPKAVRNWRVMLDKLCTLLAMVALQEAIGDWCPQSLEQASLPSCETKQEDIYAEIIVSAPAMKPLQTKEPPPKSASECVHPKNKLKGGGNNRASWIVCREYNSRWESPFRAMEVRRDLKKENLEKRRGSLSQDMGTAMVPEDMEVEMAMGEVPNVNQALTFADTTMDMNAAQVAQNLEYKMWEAPRKYEGANGRSHDANDDGVAEPEGELFARRSAPAATAAVHAERNEGEDTTPRSNDSSAAARCGGVSSDDCRANGESALGDRLRGRGINSCRSSASSECHHSGSMSLPTTCRTSEGEQRRSETRPDVLEVHQRLCNFFQWDVMEQQRLLQAQPKMRPNTAPLSSANSWQPVSDHAEIVDLVSESGI